MADNGPIPVVDPNVLVTPKTSPYDDLRSERLALNMQMQKMIDSLDTRKNLPFDPVLMKVAQGFLKPTKTGSFGESAGNAAEEAVSEVEKKRIEDQAIEKMKLDLALQKYGLKKQEVGAEFLRKTMGLDDTGSMTSEGTSTPSATGEAPTAAPRKAINYSNAIGIAASAGDTETAKMLKEMQEAETRDIVNTPNGPWSISKQKYVEPIEGTMERERAKTRAVKGTEADIENNKKSEETLVLRQGAANDTISNAQQVLDFASNPETAGAFGILAKPGAKNAFFQAIKDPLKVQDFSVGVGNIEDVLRVKNGTQAEIDAARAVGRNISNLELSFSAVFKGQGQVSDNERLIVRQVGPSLSDSPKVVALKAESIIARAKFDDINAANYEKWQKANPNGYYKNYQNSPEYKQLQTQYDNKLGEVLTKYGFKSSSTTPASVSSTVGASGSLSQRLNETYGRQE